MDFNLTKEQELVRKALAEFTEAEVKPIAADTDRNSEYPKDTIDQLFRYGVMGMCVPKEYGGPGADDVSCAIAIEELSKQCASTGDIVATHNGLCCGPIINFGTEEQKKKYLGMLTTGGKVGAFALTEPDAGSDASKGTTVCEDCGDHWKMNGSKIFITNGYVADVFVVFAMTDKTKGNKGISAFIVDKDDPGFSIGKIEHKMGIRGSQTAELIFEDVHLPADRLLGKENGGFKIAMMTLDGGRIGIASQALGIAQGALDKAIQYMKERVQFGKTLDKFQGLQWMVADMATQIDAARLLVRRAAFNKDNGLPFTKEAAMAKLYASEVAMDVTTKCVQIYGGYGYIREYPMERMMRDAKITEIYEGTSQVQRMVIAGQVLR